MCRQVQDLRSVLKGELEKLEQDLKSKREKLAQLEVRKEVLEASGLSHAPVSVQGMSKGASAQPSTPKKKKKNQQKDTLACHHKKGRSTISHT